jgi:hypothetical protein
MGHLQGLDLTCYITIGSQPKTFGERWARFRSLKPASMVHRAAIVSVVYTAIAAAVNLYFQYIYDYNRMVLVQLKDRLEHGLASKVELGGHNASLLAAEIETRIDQAHQRLKLIGSAHIEWPLVSQIIYIYCGLPALLFVFGPSFYMRHHELVYAGSTRLASAGCTLSSSLANLTPTSSRWRWRRRSDSTKSGRCFSRSIYIQTLNLLSSNGEQSVGSPLVGSTRTRSRVTNVTNKRQI